MRAELVYEALSRELSQWADGHGFKRKGTRGLVYVRATEERVITLRFQTSVTATRFTVNMTKTGTPEDRMGRYLSREQAAEVDRAG